MVICGVVLNPKVFAKLKAERVRDSKKIGPHRRQVLAKIIKKEAKDFEIVEVEAEEIDQKRRNGTNLNEIEAQGFAKVLNNLKVKKVYIDSASADSDKFSQKIQKLLKNKKKLVVEHGADERYLPVSAASIIAKVRRDERIEELKDEYGETGSGYPSDDRTVDFLKRWTKKHDEYPWFVRKSWKTAQRIKSEVVE